MIKNNNTIDPGCGEDNILPTPEWLKKLGQDIALEFGLESFDGICITGMICKALRKHEESERRTGERLGDS
jgi:hypothetical protein